MIKLTKTPEPHVLTTNAAAWTAEILKAMADGDKPTKTQKSRYNHPQIKSAIRSETSDKCAYCESKVTHVSPGDIEHIIPKSKDPNKFFDWPNLTLACRICNLAKGDFYELDGTDAILLDPYVDDPNGFFLFFREAIIARPDNDRAIATHDRLKLGRNELLERRRTLLDFINGLVIAYCNASDAVKPILLNDLQKRCLHTSSEYSAFAKHYLEKLQSEGVLP